MANKKITELTALTDPDANDLLAIVDDPSGSPLTKQITATKLVKSLNNQSATFVVAASDSVHKEHADYVCDGVDDQVQIQEGIDAMSSHGGKIQLLDGAFVFSNAVSCGEKFVTIAGVNMGTRIFLANEANCALFESTSRLSLMDLWILGQKDLQSVAAPLVHIKSGADNLFAFRCTILYSKGDGIKIEGGHLQVIDSCQIEYNDGTGVYVTGNEQTVYTHIINTLLHTNTNSIRFDGEGVSSYFFVTGSRVGAIEHSIILDGGNYTFIHDNGFISGGAVYDGIHIMNGTQNVLIRGNVFLGSNYGVNIASDDVDYVQIKDNVIENGVNVVTGANLHGLLFEQHSDFFMDVLAEDDDKIVTAVQIVDGALVIAAQSEVPRNVTVKLTDADSSVTSFSVDVVGINAKGLTITENIAFSGSPGTSTQVGNGAFAIITSATVKDLTGTATGDNIQIGIGSKLGLSNIIYETSDVFKVKKDNADYPAASYTVNATYDTVDVSTGGAIGAGNDFTIWYKSNLNIIS